MAAELATVLTPHLGYVTVESYRPQCVQDILALVNGRPQRVLP